MPAATTAIVAVAGLGLTAYQMYESSESQKEAEEAAKIAKQTLSGIKEQNKYEAVQAPDISTLAFEQLARSEASAVEALKGAGVVGAAQATNIVQAGKESALDVAQRQGTLEFQRDAAEAQAGQEIEGRRAQIETAVAYEQLEGAQLAAAEEKAQKRASAMDLVAGVGGLATAIGDATSLEAKAQRGAKKSQNTTKAQGDDLSGIYAPLEDEKTNLDLTAMLQSLNTY